MRTSVAPALEVGHEAVDNVWERRENVDDIHFLVHRPLLVDLLDVGDVLVQDVVFFYHIVQKLLAGLVDHQDLPLAAGCLSYGFEDS